MPLIYLKLGSVSYFKDETLDFEMGGSKPTVGILQFDNLNENINSSLLAGKIIQITEEEYYSILSSTPPPEPPIKVSPNYLFTLADFLEACPNDNDTLFLLANGKWFKIRWEVIKNCFMAGFLPITDETITEPDSEFKWLYLVDDDGETRRILASDISGSGTINPTDGFIPYRVDAETFGDSPIEIEAGTENVIVHNVTIFENEVGFDIYTWFADNIEVQGLAEFMGGAHIQELFRLVDAGEAVNRVLTSNALGVGTWENPASNPLLTAAFLSKTTTTISAPDGTYQYVYLMDADGVTRRMLAGDLGKNLANSNITFLTNRTHDLGTHVLTFNNGVIMADKYTLNPVASVAIANSLWADTSGVDLFWNNNSGVAKKILFNEKGITRSAISITTSVGITSNTTDASGRLQNGKLVLVENGATNINYTLDALTDTSLVYPCVWAVSPRGTGVITMVAGSGVTLINPTLLTSVAQYGTIQIIAINSTTYQINA